MFRVRESETRRGGRKAVKAMLDAQASDTKKEKKRQANGPTTEKERQRRTEKRKERGESIAGILLLLTSSSVRAQDLRSFRTHICLCYYSRASRE